MGKATTGVLARHIRRLVLGNHPEPGSDSELLQRYSQQRDEAAFATLVQRHGPMVWNACRRALGHHQDAEDVFQATFIVLARKAAVGRWRTSIAPWLYAVTQRLACKARAQAARRRPTTATVEPAAPDPFEAMTARELLTALDSEVAALPERYRGPVVLCWLEGHAQPDAADLLGTSLSTLRRNLEHGKQLLHTRLVRRGLAPAMALATSVLATAVPARALAGAVLPTAATARAAALAESLLAATGKLKAILALLGVCVLVVGLGFAAYQPSASPPVADPTKTPPPQEVPKQVQHVDALGDPLPAAALLRLGSVRLRHGAALQVVACSPTADLIASAGWDGVVRLWDAATGKERTPLATLQQGVLTLAFSPDGKWLAGGDSEGTVFLWNVATGKEVRRLEGQPARVRGLAFSAKGDVLAASVGDSVNLWDPATGKLLRKWTIEKGEFVTLALAADGRLLAAAGDDDKVRLWETDSGKLVHHLEHIGPITALVFTRDGKVLFSVGWQDIRAWDAVTGKKRQGIAGQGGAAALSPDDRLLAVGDSEGVTHVWDWAAGKVLVRLRQLPERVRGLAFLRDGKTLAGLADGGAAIHLWDAQTGQEKLALPGHQERVREVAYLPDGSAIVTASWDGTVRLWEAKTGKELRRLDADPTKKGNLSINPTMLRQLAVAPDGKQIAVVRGDETVVVWDTASGKEVHHWKGSSVAFSTDGTLIACGGRGTGADDLNKGVIRLHDRATGKMLRELRGHLTVVVGLTFTPDGKSLISRGADFSGVPPGGKGESEARHVRVWDVATGRERKSLPAEPKINGLTLAPDGRTVATFAVMGKTVKLYETLTGSLRVELQGHAQTVSGVAFSPDARVLASVSMDGTIRFWDPFAAKEIGKLEGHRGWVHAAAFSPDGTRLVSGSADTTALVWDVSRFTQHPKSVPLTAKDLESCWTDLAGDAAVSYRAIGRLLGSPKETVALLGERLKPSPSAPSERIKELVGDLDSKEFKTRDLAMKELEKLGAVAVPALEKALTAKVSLEMRQRLELLLDKVQGGNPAPDLARQLRAVEVLEGIGTAEARKLFEGLVAAGAPQGGLTQEAEAALRRWQRP